MLRPAFPLRRLRLTLALLTPLGISACATQAPTDTASPYYPPPAGTRLQIHNAIEVPPGRTRVYLQNGKLVGKFNRYAPNCNLEVRAIEQQKTQVIAPGVYTVSRVQRTLEEVVIAAPIKVAALGLLAGIGDDGGSTSYYAGYHLWLDGADANLMRLSCRGVYAEPPDALPPSIDQIRQALGDLVGLRLPNSPPA